VLWYDNNIFKIIRVKQELVITERRIKVDNIEQLTTKAEENDVNARFQLGNHYSREALVGKRGCYKKAFEWYMKAALQGHSQAQYEIGFRYGNGYGVPVSRRLSIEWYEKAAQQGNADAQYDLACYYRDGHGVKKNIETAIHLFTKSADQGQKYAQYDLGFLYDQGIGVPQNTEKAIALWQQAAAQGHGSAKAALEITST
jgi:TPR repeat protein